MAAVLERLGGEHELTLLAFVKNPLLSMPAIGEAQRHCAAVKTVRTNRMGRLLRACTGIFSSSPFETLAYRYGEMAREVAAAVAADRYDCAWLFDGRMSVYAPLLPGIPLNVDFDICYSRYLRKGAAVAPWPRRLLYRLEADRMERMERRIMAAADRCFISSEQDRASLPGEGADRVRVLPNVVDTAEFPFRIAPGPTGKILFTGRFSYGPNVDAALFFFHHILPRIRSSRPDASLWIVGSNPARAVRDLHGRENTTVTGHVESVRPFLEEAEVFVCPIRFGGGTRLKLLEAMSIGIPVVSTVVGAEGLRCRSGEHLFLADEPDQFADRVLALLDDREGRAETMRQSARQFVETNYDKAGLTISLAVPPEP